MSGGYSTQVGDKLRERAEDPNLDRIISQVLPYGEQVKLMRLLERITPVAGGKVGRA